MTEQYLIAIQALSIIAGEMPCVNSLMSDKDVAREALKMIRAINDSEATE